MSGESDKTTYTKIPGAETRKEKLAKAAEAMNKKRLQTLKRQAETVKQAADMLEKSLHEAMDTLGVCSLPLDGAINNLRAFATEDFKSREREIEKRSVSDPEEFYSFFGARDAVRAYLAGKEPTPEQKKELSDAGINPDLL